jgi:hypothetical protein
MVTSSFSPGFSPKAAADRGLETFATGDELQRPRYHYGATHTVPEHAVNSTDGPIEHIANVDPWTVKPPVRSEPSRPGPLVATSEHLTEAEPVDVGDD